MKVSVLILTCNEECNLAACLDSVDWCDDVVVLDSGSTDRTVDIARAKGARILERPFDNFAAQRNYGLDHGDFRHEWVLHLDADERIPETLQEEIHSLDGAAGVDACRVASKLMLNGRWLKHASMYPVYQVRLGRVDALRFEQVGHGQRETVPSERIGTLVEPLIHDAFAKGLKAWRKRHERYAREEAEEAVRDLQGCGGAWGTLLDRDPVERRRAAKRLSWRLPARPLLRFLYMYVLRGGMLDGAAGLQYCRLLAEYERLTDRHIRALLAT